MTSYCPVPGPVPASPANRDYQAGFTAAMMLKDLKLSQDAAQGHGAKTPLGADAASDLSQYVESGEAGQGFLRHHPFCPRLSLLIVKVNEALIGESLQLCEDSTYNDSPLANKPNLYGVI